MSTPQNGHLDEGTIHAWLDGALGAAESAEVRDHVSTCATCASAVAEARGLIAGASRIVGSLDDAQVTPVVSAGGARVASESATAPASGGSLWRLLRVTPSRAAIAATILVAIGVFATRKELGRDTLTPVRRLDSAAIVQSTTPAPATSAASPAAGALSSLTTAPPESAAGPSAALPPAPAASPVARDPLLDSAIKRRLAITQPRRTLEKAPGVDIPQAPPRASIRDEVQATAPAQSAEAALAGAGVAGGRAMTAQARDSASGLAPDRQRAMALLKSAPSERSVNAAVQLRASGVTPAPSPIAIPAPAAAPAGLSGDWKGVSTCQVHVPVCADEQVAYHVIGSPSGYEMVMNRQRGAVEEYSALLKCVLTPEGMECPGELGVWRFSVAGSEMTGKFVGKDGVVVRVVRVKRE